MAFEFLNGLGKTLVDAAENRRASERDTAVQTFRVTQQAEQVNRAHSQLTAPVRGEVLERRAAIQQARQLVDSGRFIDRLKLAELRMLDPGNFNPQVRAQRDAMDARFLSLLGETKNAQLQALQSELTTFQSATDIAKLEESIALERFTETTDMANMLAGEFSAMRGLQEEVVIGMSPTELSAALATGEQEIEVNGVMVSRNLLNERQLALADRRFTDSLARENLHKELAAEAEKRRLNTMLLLEVEEIRFNNYTDSSGVRYDPDAVDRVWQQKQQARADEVTTSIQSFNESNLPATAIRQTSARFSQIGSQVPASHPMQDALTVTQAQLGRAQVLLDAGQPDMALAHFETALSQFSQQAATFAQRDSFGDQRLEALLTDFYTTGQIDPGQFTEFVVGRLVSNKTLSSVLPPQLATIARQEYTAIRSDLLQQAQAVNLMTRLTADDRDAIDRQAAEQALSSVSYARGLELHDFAIQNQFNTPGHPLNGRMSPGQFTSLQATAEAMAIQLKAGDLGIQPADIERILNSGQIPTELQNVIPDFETLRAEMQYLGALTLQEQMNPEDVERMLRWQELNGAEYVNGVLESLGPRSSGFGETAALTLGRQWALDNWNETLSLMSIASQGRAQRAQERASALVDQRDQIKVQAIVLGMTSDLNQTEKNTLWPHLARVIQQVEQSGVAEVDRASEIRTRFSALKFDDPATQRAARLFSANWETNEQQLKNIGTSSLAIFSRGLARTDSGELRPARFLGSQDLALRRSAETMEHYTRWLEGQRGEHTRPAAPTDIPR